MQFPPNSYFSLTRLNYSVKIWQLLLAENESLIALREKHAYSILKECFFVFFFFACYCFIVFSLTNSDK